MESLKRTVEKLESRQGINKERFALILWTPHSEGGLWGHTMCFFPSAEGEGWQPLPVAYELKKLYDLYINNKRTLYGPQATESQQCSFSHFLKRYSYLGRKELEAERTKVIEEIQRLEDAGKFEPAVFQQLNAH